MARSVVVVTVPRSGSSLLAGMLHRLGVPMGREHDLVLGRHLNRLGCHEDQDFQRISLNILFDAGLLLDLEARLDVDEARLARAVARQEGTIREFVRRRGPGVWGFKDPGLVYALPHLHHLLPDPRWVHLVRDVEATARSLRKTFSRWLPELREKLPLLRPGNRLRLLPRAARLLVTRGGRFRDPAFFERVVAAGQRRAERFLEGRDHLRVEFREIIGEPERVARELADHVGIRPTPEAVAAAVAFVHPDMLSSAATPRPS